jgi:hypothetical protein
MMHSYPHASIAEPTACISSASKEEREHSKDARFASTLLFHSFFSAVLASPGRDGNVTCRFEKSESVEMRFSAQDDE